MQKIKIVCFGKMKLSGSLQMQKEFEKRLSSSVKLEVVELAHKPITQTYTVEKALKEEEGLILKHISSDFITVLLDIHGSPRTSEEFAAFLDRLFSLGRPIAFIIGSSHGVSTEVKGNANHSFSMSKLTFTHELARILLLEQVYRGLQILNHTQYHK